MMSPILAFIGGLWVGCALGFLLASVLKMASDADELLTPELKPSAIVIELKKERELA